MGVIGRWMGRLAAAVTLVHPAPTLAVVALSAALGAILLGQAGSTLDERWLLVIASVAGSQIFTGALNDIADADRDAAAGRRDKPLASGRISSSAALWVASAGLALQLAASWRLGSVALLLGLAAVGSAAVYDLFLSRTPLSPLPYMVSFGILPLWIAAGVGVPAERVLPGVPLAAAFAAAAHLANTLRDYDADAAVGSRSLAQHLGRRRTHLLALGLALAVGLGVGTALLLGGRAGAASLALGAIGLLAIGQGASGSRRLWFGVLVAAVAWTGAWALSTG
ncbi:MAG TPA: UbiA family prenyltransferase [Candidatus Limnocylindria bacterium]